MTHSRFCSIIEGFSIEPARALGSIWRARVLLEAFSGRLWPSLAVSWSVLESLGVSWSLWQSLAVSYSISQPRSLWRSLAAARPTWQSLTVFGYPPSCRSADGRKLSAEGGSKLRMISRQRVISEPVNQAQTFHLISLLDAACGQAWDSASTSLHHWPRDSQRETALLWLCHAGN